MAAGQDVRGGLRTPSGVADASGDKVRADSARALLVSGMSRGRVAAQMKLSVSGLAALLKRDDERRAEEAAAAAKARATLGPDGGHLIAFDLPPALPPRVFTPAEEAAWFPRLIFVGRLNDMAAAFPGSVGDGLRHLADLHEFHPTFYPNVLIREGDGLPWRGEQAPVRGLIGSSALMCAEG